MYRVVFIAFVAFFLGHTLSAQIYQRSLGLRLNQKDYGISYRQHIDSVYAVDATASFSVGSFILSGLYEREKSFFHPRLYGRVGGGAHFGVVNTQGIGTFTSDRYANSNILLGLRGVAGVEWIDVAKKMIFSFDIIPAVEFIHTPFVYVMFALSGHICIDEAFKKSDTP